MKEKVALITGGSSGIGKATAIAFVQKGIRVAIASRQKAKAEKALEEIEKAGGNAIWIQADVSQSEDVKRMVGEVISTFGRLDYAFNKWRKWWKRSPNSRYQRRKLEQDNSRVLN